MVSPVEMTASASNYQMAIMLPEYYQGDLAVAIFRSIRNVKIQMTRIMTTEIITEATIKTTIRTITRTIIETIIKTRRMIVAKRTI